MRVWRTWRYLKVFWSVAAPGVGGDLLRKTEELDGGAVRKRLYHGARCGLDFGDGFADGHAGDALDFIAEGLARRRKKLTVELVNLGSAFRSLGQDLFRERQGIVQRDDQGIQAQDHVDGLGGVACGHALKFRHGKGDLLGHGGLGKHEVDPVFALGKSTRCGGSQKTDTHAGGIGRVGVFSGPCCWNARS